MKDKTMVGRFIFLIILALAAGVGGCTDAKMQQIESLGSNHVVTLYAADGHIIKQWTATGNVANESGSDGWYFRDAATGKLVEITGTIIVEQK
jgi:hypothetical protein